MSKLEGHKNITKQAINFREDYRRLLPAVTQSS